MTKQRKNAALALTLDRKTQKPLYRQIYERVKVGITSGSIRPGDRLPSARGLANRLGVARGTVDTAYELLQGEGYVIARRPTGSVVSPILSIEKGAKKTNRRSQEPKIKSGDRNVLWPAATGAEMPLQIGLPAFDMFPRKLWSRVVAHRARSIARAEMGYPDPRGYLPLRQAIASYVTISRGIDCRPEEVLVTSGYQGALDLVVRTLLATGDRVWFEDPGYFRVRMMLEAEGINIVPIPVDSAGLDVQYGIERAKNARAAIVTPAHQQPLGYALSLARRIELLSWAKSTDAWVIEDDYDGEFHYVGRPLAALKSLDQHGRVIYIGSFSKVLLPSLRLGYLIGPESLVDRLSRDSQLRLGSIPVLIQTIVADFMIEGHFARHLKRMRDLYSVRRESLANAVSQIFGDRISMRLQAGGMHLIAHIRSRSSDVELVRLARLSGLAPSALSRHTIARNSDSGLLLGFTNVPEDEATMICQRLDKILGNKLLRHHPEIFRD